jgi:hypothetical protein
MSNAAYVKQDLPRSQCNDAPIINDKMHTRVNGAIWGIWASALHFLLNYLANSFELITVIL